MKTYKMINLYLQNATVIINEEGQIGGKLLSIHTLNGCECAYFEYDTPDPVVNIIENFTDFKPQITCKSE